MTTANTNATSFLGQNPFVGLAGPALMSSGGLFSTPDGIQAQYSYAVSALTPVATPTDVVVIQGSATKTVRIKYIYVGGAATAAGSFPVTVIRRLSTGGTIGSAVLTAVTAGYSDINNAAPTAVVSTVGTANYTTVQTANGLLATGRAGLIALTSAAVYAPFIFAPQKAILLRGTADYVMINLNGGAVPSGGVLDITVLTEEDAS